jgi:hypothetical protein
MLTVTFPSVEKLLEGYSSGIAVKAPDVKISEPKYGSMQGDPWLTAKGIVLPRFDRESRFVRYGIETLREIDFLSLEDTEYVRYAFLPDGKKWLFYDERTGDLHLLRTGW